MPLERHLAPASPRRTILAGLLLLGLLLTGCSGSAPASGSPKSDDRANSEKDKTETGSEKVTLALNWFPESEHGGYYAAQVRGYYREAGLDVTIQSGGPNAHMLEQVATGRATFGIANADNILFARAEQVKVVAVLAPLQNSPRCILVHQASGIDSLEKLRDVTLAMTPGAAFADYLRWKLPLEGVQIVPYSGNLEPFLASPKYAQQGYNFSEPYLARQQGADPRVLMVSDLGFNPYTSLLFTTGKTVATRPDLVRRMVAASVRGWQDYLADPETTNQKIHELNPVVDMKSLAFAAKQIAPLVMVGDALQQGLGIMTDTRWQTLADQLVESGQLASEAVQVEKAFSLEFLPKAASEPAADR